MIEPVGKFYTEQAISRLLIENMSSLDNEHIIDLGAGNGSLLYEAGQRWTGARLLAAEQDPLGLRDLEHRLPEAHIVCADGLRLDLPARLGEPEESIDAAVCNPPYVHLSVEKEHQSILESAGLSALCNEKALTSDIMFLAQNLRMLRPGGELGIILPDGLLTGHNFEVFRQALIASQKVRAVIQLPDKVFSKTEARTHMLILKKGGYTNHEVPLFSADKNGKLISKTMASPSQLIERMDPHYHMWKKKNDRYYSDGPCLKELGVEIIRGRNSHKYFRTNNIPCFHTCHLSESNKIALPRQKQHTEWPVAKTGDIVMARVGSRCIGRVAYIKSGSCPITDCVFILRAPTNIRLQLLKSLLSKRGQEWLAAKSHGVCARVISKCDLQSFCPA